MSNQILSFRVNRPEHMDRVHMVIRLVLLMAIGAIGCSSVYWLAYLILPALAALLIVQKGGDRYLAEDAPRILRLLKWLASAYAYLWLLTDTVPSTEAGRSVELQVEPGGLPTTKSALLRLLYSLPALVLLAVASFLACLFWAIGAVAILAVRRVPAFVSDFLAATLRYQFRLIAYHLSLVDAYPSFEETGIPHASSPGAA